MTVSTIGLRTSPMFQKQYQRNDCGQEPFYRKCFISSGLRNAQTSIKAHCERDKIYSKAIPNDDENLQLITSLEASTFAIHFQLQFLKINLANNFPKYLKNYKICMRNYIIPKLVLQGNHDNIQQLHTAVDIATLWYIAVYDL